jgi:capsular exopolysaccharide synthesis family protein
MSNMLITHLDSGAAASEAFRVLRTNLQFMSLDKPLKCVAITSATPGEGKTTIASNLAVAFAQTGARVCLVDADLRIPMVAKFLGLPNWSGLTTALVTQGRLEEQLQETAVPGLTALTSGPTPPNPAELLGSNRMARLLDDLRDRFDMVVVDTPPVLAVTDAAVIAPKVDGTLLVVRAGEVARQQVVSARQALEAVKANVLGVVLGAVESGRHGGYQYYYYYNDSGDGHKGRRKSRS